jgi:CRP-like cAMP-binding protein
MTQHADLGDCQLFQDLSLEQRSRIYALCELAEYPDGEIIFSEGDVSDLLYIVLEGEVRISLSTPGAGEEALALCGPGTSFGGLNLLDERPAQRSADAIAHGDCALATLSRTALLTLTERDPELGYRIARNALDELGDQMRQTNQKLRFFAATSLFG